MPQQDDKDAEKISFPDAFVIIQKQRKKETTTFRLNLLSFCAARKNVHRTYEYLFHRIKTCAELGTHTAVVVPLRHTIADSSEVTKELAWSNCAGLAKPRLDLSTEKTIQMVKQKFVF